MQDKPTPPAINLDSLERESIVDPFVFILGGKRITMNDATELDWQTLLLATENPVSILRLIVPSEDQEAFFEAKLPSWKLERLMRSYFEHFGVDPERLAALSR